MSESISIVERGHGPLQIALIHGWAMTSDLFATIADHFNDLATLHLIDLPGHGRSRDCTTRIDTVDAVADELASRIPANAVWLGWSMGGLFAQAAAQRAQARGLIFVSSTPCFAAREDWTHGLKPSVLETMKQAVMTDARKTVNDFLQLEVLGTSRSHPSLDTIRQEAFGHGLPRTDALEQGLQLLENADIRGEIASLRVPNLWIGGSRDRLVTPSTLHAAAQMNPHGRSEVLQGAGHAAFISAPGDLNRHLENFAVDHGWL